MLENIVAVHLQKVSVDIEIRPCFEAITHENVIEALAASYHFWNFSLLNSI